MLGGQVRRCAIWFAGILRLSPDLSRIADDYSRATLAGEPSSICEWSCQSPKQSLYNLMVKYIHKHICIWFFFVCILIFHELFLYCLGVYFVPFWVAFYGGTYLLLMDIIHWYVWCVGCLTFCEGMVRVVVWSWRRKSGHWSIPTRRLGSVSKHPQLGLSERGHKLPTEMCLMSTLLFSETCIEIRIAARPSGNNSVCAWRSCLFLRCERAQPVRSLSRAWGNRFDQQRFCILTVLACIVFIIPAITTQQSVEGKALRNS